MNPYENLDDYINRKMDMYFNTHQYSQNNTENHQTQDDKPNQKPYQKPRYKHPFFKNPSVKSAIINGKIYIRPYNKPYQIKI